MPEGAIPVGAIPAAAPANGATNGSTGADGGQAPAPGVVKPGAVRGPDGKFVGANAAGSETPAPAAEAPKPFHMKKKLNLHGKEQEVEYKSEEELWTDIQRGRAAQARGKDAAEAYQKAQRLLGLLSDPNTFEMAMQELGHDPDAFAVKRLSTKAQREMMTDEQRQIADLTAQLAEKTKAEETHAQAQQRQEQEAQETQAFERMQKTVFDALDKSAALGLDKGNPETVYEMASVLRQALDDEGIEYSPEQLAAETARRLEGRTQRYLAGHKGEKLLSRLGKDVVEEVVRAVTEEFEKSQGIRRTSPTARPAEPAKPSEPLTEAEVNRRMREIGRGG